MYIQTDYNHSIEVTLDVMCGKWKGLILCKLIGNTLRFGELKSEIPNISKKVLTQQLRELEADGVIERVAYNETPPKVEYSLTAIGKDLKPALDMLSEWGLNYIDIVAESKLQTET